LLDLIVSIHEKLTESAAPGEKGFGLTGERKRAAIGTASIGKGDRRHISERNRRGDQGPARKTLACLSPQKGREKGDFLILKKIQHLSGSARNK